MKPDCIALPLRRLHHPTTPIHDMADDQGGASGSTASTSPSSPDVHAQAVRFLTSIRHHSPSSTTSSQREFLKSKGLDEGAIDAAFRDAERPQSSVTPVSDTTSSSEEAATFDAAARAFDDPIHNPMPAVPARTYPKSPLALYYDESSPSAVGITSPQTRYQVLLQFFRSLSWFLTFGGALGAVGVVLYRTYVLPRMTATLDARSILLKYHHELWDRVFARVTTLREGRVAVGVIEEDKTPGVKRVQFADEVDGGKLELREGEDVVSVGKKKGENGEKDGDDEGNKTADTEEASSTTPRLPPIDLSEPLRTSLSALSDGLRLGRKSQSNPTSRSPTVSDSPSDDGSDSSSSSSSDSWQDTSNDEADADADDEDVEFDPFAAPKSKTKPQVKSSTPTKHWSEINSSAPSSSALYASLTSLSSSITSRHLANQSRLNKYNGTFSWNSAGSSDKSSTADPSIELAAQIKAEIRSLKGLLLSRRNFPRHGIQSQVQQTKPV